MPRIPKLILISFVVLVTLCVLTFTLGPLVYRTYKSWRANHLAEDSQAFFDNQSYEDAWDAAQTAYKLDPANPKVNRTIAKLYDTIDAERALPFWTATVSKTQDPEDRKDLIESALQGRDLALAQAQLAILKENAQDDAETLFLEAEYFYRQNAIHEALSTIEQCLTKPNPPERAHLLYATLCIESELKDKEDAAFAYLKTIALTEPPPTTLLSLQALRILANYYLKAGDTSKVADALDKHPQSTRADHLLAIHVRYRLQLLSKDQALKAAESYFNLDIPDDKLQFLQWLNSQGFYALTLQLLSKEESLKRQDLFLVWLDAMAVQKRWKELSILLAVDSTAVIPLEPDVLWIFRSRIYNELGQAQRSQIAWSKALLVLNQDPSKLWGALYYALQMKDPQKIRTTFQALIQIPSSLEQAYAQWINWEKTNGHTQAMLSLLERMLTFFPDNTSIQNDLTYTQLLLKKDCTTNLKKAQDLVNAAPLLLAHRMTLALALLRTNDPQMALSTLLNLPLNWAEVSSSYRLVAAAILEANGHTEDAVAMLQGMSLASTLPEERALVSPLVLKSARTDA